MTDDMNANAPDFIALRDAQAGKAADANAVAILDAVDNWNSGVTTYGISDAARDALREARDEIKNGVGALRGADDEARRWLNDKSIYPEGRQERATAARKAGQHAANAAFSRAEIQALIAEKTLIAESAPAWGNTVSETAANKQLARADARMLLDSAEGEGLAQALQNLAQLDSPISTLVTGEWLGLYLASRGVKADEATALRELATEAALDARAKRGSKSAQLVFAMRRGIRGSLGGARALAGNQIHRS